MVSSNDVQRLFLQAIISRRVVSQTDAVLIWRKCVDAVKACDETLEIPFLDDRNSWDNWITEVNASLNPLNLEIGHFLDQATGKESYVLVNRKGDEIAQMATGYTPIEITFFKGIVEQIMLAPYRSYCISSMAALREVKALKLKMLQSQAEVVLSSFVSRGWLEKSSKGRYSLSQRSVLELQQYLRSTYPDEIMECTICFEMVTHGVACATPRCQVQVHQYCYNQHRRRNQNCPACGNSWTPNGKNMRVDPIGEGAFKDGQDRLKRRGRRREGSGDDEEGEEVEYEEEPSQATQPSQSQKKGKGKKKAVQGDSMDVDGDEEEVPPTQTQRRSRRRK